MKDYKQICVWPGTLLAEDDTITNANIKAFEEFFKKEFGVTVRYLETVTTLPDKGDATTGGRKDVFFTLEEGDIARFSVMRLAVGIRWYEDYLDNGGYDILPPDIIEKYPRGW